MHSLRHPYAPEYTGSVFTSCFPLTNYEREAIYYWKRAEVKPYRVWNKGVRKTNGSARTNNR